MKRGLIILLFLSISFVTAEPILKFQHENIQEGETILAKINTTGDFYEKIKISQVSFFEGRRSTFFEYDIIYHNNTHYLYAYANRQGNFSIKISDITYLESDILKSTTIEKNFQIILPSEEVLSIRPGFLSFDKDKIILNNIGVTNLSIEILDNQTTINPNQIYEFYPPRDEEFKLITVYSYLDFTIPIFSELANTTTPPQIKRLDLKASPEFPVINAFVDTELTQTIQLFNFADLNLTITNITSSKESIIPQIIENLSAKEAINYTIQITQNETGYFEEKIFLTYTDEVKVYTLEIPIAIYVLPKENEKINATPNFTIATKTCEDLNGSTCQTGKICNGETRFTKGSVYCCLAECVQTDEKDESDSSNWIWGVIIISIILIIAFLLYNRSKKAGPVKPDQQIKQKADDFEKRISGGLQRS